MNCPFCRQELEIGGVDGILRGCPKCRNLGTETLWQELIRTRKAFDVAVDGLLEVWRATGHTTKQGSIAYNVLRDLNIKPLDRIKQITKTKE